MHIPHHINGFIPSYVLKPPFQFAKRSEDTKDIFLQYPLLHYTAFIKGKSQIKEGCSNKARPNEHKISEHIGKYLIQIKDSVKKDVIKNVNR